MEMLVPSARAIAEIESFEIGNRASYVERPSWPGGSSGLTIGVGYDLGYSSSKQIAEDWANLSKNVCDRLRSYAGIVGSDASRRLAETHDIAISYECARQVFESRDIPRTIDLTVRAFQNCEYLPPDCLGALVSLIFNRGSSMNDTQPNANRLEMREIRDAMGARSFDLIPGYLRAMKRLWLNRGLDGLLARRDAEAALFEAGLKQIKN